MLRLYPHPHTPWHCLSMSIDRWGSKGNVPLRMISCGIYPVWCGWPRLPCSSLYRLALVSGSSCCALLWSPPILKCQPAPTGRKGRTAGRGLLCRWCCYVMRRGLVKSLWLMLPERVQNTSGAGRGGTQMRIPMQTVRLCRLNASSTACYDFEGLLEFHSRVQFVRRPRCGKPESEGLKLHWLYIILYRSL